MFFESEDLKKINQNEALWLLIAFRPTL